MSATSGPTVTSANNVGRSRPGPVAWTNRSLRDFGPAVRLPTTAPTGSRPLPLTAACARLDASPPDVPLRVCHAIDRPLCCGPGCAEALGGVVTVRATRHITAPEKARVTRRINTSHSSSGLESDRDPCSAHAAACSRVPDFDWIQGLRSTRRRQATRALPVPSSMLIEGPQPEPCGAATNDYGTQAARRPEQRFAGQSRPVTRVF